MIPNTQFCLRPDLTATIYELLKEGKKVNLYGSDCQGLTRLVDDLAKISEDDKHFIRLSMRSYADSYAGFMSALHQALGIQSEDNGFASAIHTFIDKSPKTLWLVIEHFDRLTEKPEPSQSVDIQGFDRPFLDQLNSFGNNPKISLLFTSARKINTQELYIGGRNIRGSKLELSRHLNLTPLTFDLYKAELNRLLNNRINTETFFAAPEWSYLVGELSSHPESYDFLNFIAPRIENSRETSLDNFKKQVTFWKKEYSHVNSPSVDLRLNKIEKMFRHCLDFTNRVMGLSKVVKKLNTKWGRILLGLSAIGLGWWRWGEQIWAWVSKLIAKF